MARTSHSRHRTRASRTGAMTAMKYGSRPSALAILYTQSNGRCFYCGDKCTMSAMSIDHLVPVVQGGLGTLDNMVACCRPCNSAKGGRTLEEYRTACGGATFPGER